MARRGLTLVELLIVIGAISLLAALSFPALLRVRNQAQGTVCTQNLKTLSLAWLLYKDENDDRLVGGQIGKYSYDWLQRPTGAGTILERQKEGVRQGALFRGAGGNVDVYRCPADQRVLNSSQMAFCSYSIAGGANGETLQNAYAPAVKYSDIAQPATKCVFVEEADPRGWNRGSWLINPALKIWVDPVAVWHGGSRSGLGYADGHVEMHRWVDRSTIEMSRDFEFVRPVPPTEGQDLRFMLAGFPQKTTDAPVGGAP
ncbi:MAG: type II secretion system GspH family protein [Planctomycetes bacterium]|nr:type II secretion system GspH family protein [Planctomycetota bacterium]